MKKNLFNPIFYTFNYIFARLKLYENMDIRKNFKEITRRKGLKLYEVAELAGMRPADLSNMLNGDMRTSTAKKIASALGVSVDELLKEEDTQPNDIESSAPEETTEQPNDIEKRIRHFAHLKGLKLYELSNKIGLSSSGSFSLTIRRDMRLSTLQKIADALGVPVSALLEDRTDKAEPAKNAVFCPVCGASLRLSSPDTETE